MKFKISRKKYLTEKLLIIDGLPGCGKTMLSKIVSSLDRMEILNYAFEIEFICKLHNLNKITEDATSSLSSMLVDHKLYQSMMGRETNFRYSDLSSVFNYPFPLKYFKRIFSKGELQIPKKIIDIKPILNLTTHNLLPYSDPIFTNFKDRLLYIELKRHPLYMIIQHTLNMERLLNNPRDIQVLFDYEGYELPYFAYGWEDLFIKSNPVEKAIYFFYYAIKKNDQFKKKLSNKNNENFLSIKFEEFVFDPTKFLNIICKKLNTSKSSRTNKILKIQKVPRKKLAESIDLDIYRRCGWKPPTKNLNEKEELKLRREFCINQGANKNSMNILDEISNEYEQNLEKKIFN